MTFIEPEYLLLGWLLPLLSVVAFWAHRRRRAAEHRFAQRAMLVRLMPDTREAGWWGRLLLTLVAIGLLVAAAARPQWGEYYEEVPLRGIDIFVLLDVSRSMLADDVAPSRLERAKSDIRDLLEAARSDRMGLIVFAGAPVIHVPLTQDRQFFLALLEHVDADSAPRGGSMIGDAIRKAVDAFDERVGQDRVLLILTDGEDHDSYPEEAVALAAARGVKIFAVGLGDIADGGRIPLTAATGERTYLQHQGEEVWSRLDESLLKRLALSSGGAYVPARTRTYDLGQIYRDHLSGLAQGELTARRQKKRFERFQWFVALAGILLVLETIWARYPRGMEALEESAWRSRPEPVSAGSGSSAAP